MFKHFGTILNKTRDSKFVPQGQALQRREVSVRCRRKECTLENKRMNVTHPRRLLFTFMPVLVRMKK